MKDLAFPVHAPDRTLGRQLLAMAVALFFAGCSPSIIGGLASDDSSSSSNVSLDDVWSVVTLSPDIQAIVAGGSFTFVASGGTAPYTYEARNGSIDASSGLYTAPMAPGGDLVTVTDADGYRAIASVTIYAPLAISPTTTTLATGNEATFESQGGMGPYVFSAEAGTIDPSTGEYTAPAEAGSDTVTVTDSEGNEETADIVIVEQPLIGLTPLRFAANPNASFLLDASGGVGTLHYYLLEGSGTVDPDSGAYTPPRIRSNETASVVDSLGNTTSVPMETVPFKVNGPVYSLVTSGPNVFVGGYFTATDPLFLQSFGIVDPDSGDLTETICNYANRLDPWAFIMAMVVTEDSIYLGGGIYEYGGQLVENLIKIDRHNCELDTTFTHEDGSAAYVRSLLLEGDQLYVGVEKSWWSTPEYRNEAVPSFFKVNALTGERDTAFTPAGGPDGTVNTIASHGGALYLGGAFWSYDGQVVSRVARVDAVTGDLDTSFTGGAGGEVKALHFAGDALYVGGQFGSYQGNGGARYIAKVDPDTGILDSDFSALGGPDSYVYTFESTATSLYVGGYFNTFRGNLAENLAKLDLITGVMDTDFSDAGGADTYVDDIAVVGSSLYVAGWLESYRGQPVGSLIKIDAATGALDTNFTDSIGFDNEVAQISAETDGLYVAGYFTNFSGDPSYRLAKLDVISNEPDPDFDIGSGLNDAPRVFLASGDSLFVGGDFTDYNGVTVGGLVKINASTGAIDPTFDPGIFLDNSNPWYPNQLGQVHALAQIGSSLYVGGDFTHYDGQEAYRLAKLDATTGALDTTFTQSTGFDNTVYALQAYGTSLFVGGGFTTYRSAGPQVLTKLDATSGDVDAAFSAGIGTGPDAGVFAFAIANGALYVGGNMGLINGTTARKVAKLDLDTAAIDTTFTQSTGFSGGAVKALLAAGDSLYVAGEFSTYRGSSAQAIAKIDLDTGDLDTTFTQSVGFDSNSWFLGAYALTVVGGSLWIGGDFDSYRDEIAPNLTTIHLTTGDLTD